MARAKQVHVTWSDKWCGWTVKLNGKVISNKIGFQTKPQAVEFAKKKARAVKGELVIHGQGGKIQRKHSYGNDPVSTKG